VLTAPGGESGRDRALLVQLLCGKHSVTERAFIQPARYFAAYACEGASMAGLNKCYRNNVRDLFRLHAALKSEGEHRGTNPVQPVFLSTCVTYGIPYKDQSPSLKHACSGRLISMAYGRSKWMFEQMIRFLACLRVGRRDLSLL